MVRRKYSGSERGSSSGSSSTYSSKTEVLVNKRKKVRGRRIIKALWEIKYFRSTTKLVIPKLPFSRLVRQIVYELFSRDSITRMQQAAFEALQESAEMYMVQFYEDSILLSSHAKRVTLMRRDMVLLRRLRGRDDVINK